MVKSLNRQIVFIGVLLLIVLSCTTGNNEKRVQVDIPFTYPVIEGADTVENEKYYEAKVFLSDDTMYEVARQNGIKDYLKIKYEYQPGSSDYAWATQDVEMKGDTGFVKFKVQEILREGEVKAVKWMTQFDISYLNGSNQIDTVFKNMGTIYVKSGKPSAIAESSQ